MGWTSYPVKCPTCGRRVKETAIVTHGGALRCDRGCVNLLYLVPAHGMVFVAELSSSEALAIRERGLSLFKALEYLGAGFPEAA
jgi:hypothetical protein